MKTFTDLQAWQVGLELVKEIYRLTKKFPKEELYGLTSQMRRSSVSILANIAEGFGRFTYPDKANKYTIARGECSETEAFLLIAIALGFVSTAETQKAMERTQRVGRLVSGLITSCKHRSKFPVPSTPVFQSPV